MCCPIVARCVAWCGTRRGLDLRARDAEGEAHAYFLELDADFLRHVGIQLTGQQIGQGFHHMDLFPQAHQPIGRLKPQQAAADDQYPVPVLKGILDGVQVIEGSQREHPGLVRAGNRWDKGRGAGGQQQPVVGDFLSREEDDLPVFHVDAGDCCARPQNDALGLIPFRLFDEDVVDGCIRAGQQVGQLDAKIGRVAVRAQHQDLGGPVLFSDGLCRRPGGDAGANDDVLHDVPLSLQLPLYPCVAAPVGFCSVRHLMHSVMFSSGVARRRLVEEYSTIPEDETPVCSRGWGISGGIRRC
jgi:hypothetical protein